jgi:hypothetical protein
MNNKYFPGWLMTVAQHASYFHWWGKACEFQGWDKLPAKDRDLKRKATHADVFGFPISAKDIDHRDGFTKIISRFRMLAGDLKGAIEDGEPHHNERRIMLDEIAELMRCVALYKDDAESYVSAILLDRFKTVDVESLSAVDRGRIPSLKQCLWKLRTTVNALRKEAEHSVHDMKCLAKLRCDCAACKRENNRLAISEAFAGDTNEPF